MTLLMYSRPRVSRTYSSWMRSESSEGAHSESNKASFWRVCSSESFEAWVFPLLVFSLWSRKVSLSTILTLNSLSLYSSFPSIHYVSPGAWSLISSALPLFFFIDLINFSLYSNFWESDLTVEVPTGFPSKKRTKSTFPTSCSGALHLMTPGCTKVIGTCDCPNEIWSLDSWPEARIDSMTWTGLIHTIIPAPP